MEPIAWFRGDGMDMVVISDYEKGKMDYGKDFVNPLFSESIWQPIRTAPKDGSEFVAANANQGFVKTLVKWNTIHGFWESKGSSINMQDTHWMPLIKNEKRGQ
jgi:hypothetical protein